jgi:hypothetical protein
MIRKTIAISSLAAAVAIGGASIVLNHGVNESISLNVNDTISPRFSFHTDTTILKLSGNNIVVSGCGISQVYLRLFQHSIQITADTIIVNIPCTITPTKIASISICLHPDTSALHRYNVSSDTSIDPALVPCLDSLISAIYHPTFKFSPNSRLASSQLDTGNFSNLYK